MAGALAEVKKDLGADAVILRTRSFKAGGVLGFGGNSIVEITAARDAPAGGAAAPKIRPKPAGPKAVHPHTAPARDEAGGLSVPERAGAGATPAQPGPATTPTHREDRPGRRVVPSTRVSLRPVSEEATAALESELASIKGMISQVLQTTRRTAVQVEGAESLHLGSADRSDPLFDLYNTLLDHDVPMTVLDAVVAAVRDELSAGELADPAIVRETLLRHLAGRIRVVGKPESPAAGPVVEALIGPTGVGKTTTIAKLAAAQKLRYGRAVGLITADTYRIAAVEQLRTYAGIIGIPLEVVLRAEDMPPALERLRSCDVVLIDTPGRSPRDAARLEQLAGFLEAASPSRTHLVMSAGSSPRVFEAIAGRFAGAGPDCVIVSKVDEAAGMGMICHALEVSGLPLSYITTGQEVPDHIEPARPERLARLILEGRL